MAVALWQRRKGVVGLTPPRCTPTTQVPDVVLQVASAKNAAVQFASVVHAVPAGFPRSRGGFIVPAAKSTASWHAPQASLLGFVFQRLSRWHFAQFLMSAGKTTGV